MLHRIKKKMTMAGVLVIVGAIWGGLPVFAAEMPVESVSENSVSENSVPVTGEEEKEDEMIESDIKEEETEQPAETEVQDTDELQVENEADVVQPEEEPVTVNADQFQSINYQQTVLTDWQQVLEALATLTPEALTSGGGGGTLVLQLQNVDNIPSEVKGSLTDGGTGYTKILQCGLGYGVSIVINGAEDNSGFRGIGNTRVWVDSEKRGKKSVATTVHFDSHEDLGAVVSLQVNLPQCSKGTKVSVYAETVAMDEEGNVIVGENACIGTTKAGENGNVEIPIQSTANYMFVYKGAKE